MFGATEDRARQLAYRKRRERIISGDTCTVYRSMSSARQVSPQSRLSFIPDDESFRVPVHTEHRAPQAGTMHSENIPATKYNKRCLEFDPVLKADPLSSQMVQHRLQAEHLSQVLYSTLSTATPAPKPPSVLSPSSVLGMQGMPGRHIRNITAPVALADLSSLFVSASQGRRDLPTLPFLPRIPCNGQLHPPAVSLRGGGDAHDPFWSRSISHPNNSGQAPPTQHQTQMTQTHMQAEAQAHAQAQVLENRIQVLFFHLHTHERQYLTLFPWAREYRLTPGFFIPISCGSHFDSFLGSIPLDAVNYFLDIFGLQRLPTSYTSPAANARRYFYLQLDKHARSKFQNVIFARHTELMAARVGHLDPQVSLQARPNHGVMLYHLMEAIETIFVPRADFFQSEADYDAYMSASRLLNNNVATRSSSAPSLSHESEPTG
jgi:hypothetical protein